MMLIKFKTVTVVLMGSVAIGGTLAIRHTATAQQVVITQGEMP